MPPRISRERFGPIRSAPPELARHPASAAVEWTRSPIGDGGAYPNGGLWRFDSSARSLFVKRIGAAYLGGDPVWQLSRDERDPQWWGREVAFYRSELARDGWSDTCSPADCVAVDAREDEVDLWLEYVDGVPLPVTRYDVLVAGLARWQAAHRTSTSPVLSRGWLAQHVARRRLENATTAGHPGWDALLAAGLNPEVRVWVEGRITDPARLASLLGALPQLATHHDFHSMNLGSFGDRIVIVDWATVGWGPVGHDVGNLVIDRAADGDIDVADLWPRLLDVYGRELRAAGVDLDQETISRSAAMSTVIRMGWIADFLLQLSEAADPRGLRSLISVANFLAGLAIADPA